MSKRLFCAIQPPYQVQVQLFRSSVWQGAKGVLPDVLLRTSHAQDILTDSMLSATIQVQLEVHPHTGNSMGTLHATSAPLLLQGC